MSAAARLLVYGATGYTGRLVAAEVARRGLPALLAGRDSARVAAVAGPLGLPWRAFPLGDRAGLAAGLAGADTVLNCAGPFVLTAAPLLAACLERRAAYLDIAGEIDVLEAALGRGAAARAAGVAVVPGVGFDVVPTDGLAARLAAALPGAVLLELAFTSGGGWSGGTLATSLARLPQGGAERSGGEIVTVPLARDELTVDFPRGRRLCVSVPWGDVATAFHTTGIGDIRVYAALPRGQVRLLRALRPALRLLAVAALLRLAQRAVRAAVEGPDEAARVRARAEVWGRVARRSGETVTGTVTTPEAYSFTAVAAVECAARVLAGAVAPGAWTPALAFPGLLEQLPGVTVGPLHRAGA